MLLLYTPNDSIIELSTKCNRVISKVNLGIDENKIKMLPLEV